MIRNGGVHWRKSLAVTLILIFVTVTLSFVTVRWINQAEENDSFERLYEEALKKHQVIIQSLKDEADADQKRLDYLQSLNILLTQAIKDLRKDLSIKDEAV